MPAERATDDHGLPRQPVGCRFRLLHCHLQSGLAQSLDEAAVLLVREIGHYALRYHRPHALHLQEVIGPGDHECVDVLEMAGELLGDHLADEPYAEGVDYTLERDGTGTADALDDALGRPLARSVGAVDVLRPDVVKIRRVMDKSTGEIVVHRLRPERTDVHRVATDKVFYATFQLGRAGRVVRTIGGCLTFVAHQAGPAFRTVLDERHGRRPGLPCRRIDTHHLGNDFTGLLHVNPIALMEVELPHDVLVVQ